MDQIPSKLPFSKKRLRTRVVLSALFIGFYILDAVEPYHQHFSLRNISLQYPYAVKERITIQEALLISLAFPIVVIAVYTLVIDGLFSHHKPSSKESTSGRRKLSGRYRWKDRLWELNCGILGLFLSQALAFVITQVLKNACGKPRPDLIDRCQPRPGSEDHPVYGLSNSTICTGDPKILKDGFRSWPSASFAGLFYLSLYLCGKMHVLDNRGEVWKTIIVMIPCLAAALVAVSRIMDARHHPFDVISGSLLGVFTAWASYRQYFPPISEAWRKGRAYPIRSWGTEPTPPMSQERSLKYAESVEPLRNPDEERLDVRGERRMSLQSGRGASTSPSPHPAALQPGVYNPRHRGRDDNYSSSSSEDEAERFEMTTTSTAHYARPVNVTLPRTAYQPYDTDTAYHPPSHQGDRPAAVSNVDNRGRPLTSERGPGES
ncbi:PAP2 domain protein [Rasamsonia emersonii CBS 393.64]|uniref:PAP2 domain protein n=1 Tax=Rasamsonia emersonii (strain ATCC 16479 / CBS 393.64 / IMI 116815) TaxID=1408163 RepID=A0A0F4YXQ2_RASE3|nr:PAP2 domain protein [Rasamsonia emersonii CBS 393.64]KKA22860.1 PAP2 domain protein [Rasamsonia emersonii CBS 393.64]